MHQRKKVVWEPSQVLLGNWPRDRHLSLSSSLKCSRCLQLFSVAELLCQVNVFQVFCCHKTNWRRAPATTMVFWEKKKERKKRNESTKRAKESEERSKEQMSEIEEKKKKGTFYTIYSILTYVWRIMLPDVLGLCKKDRKWILIIHSSTQSDLFKIIEKICRAYYILLKQLLTEIVCCCHRLKLWRRPHYTTVNLLNDCDKFYLCLCSCLQSLL